MRGAAVADLDHQSVEEHDRVDVLQRPLLPGSDVIHDRVGDAADEVVPDLDTIELGQVRLNVAHRHPAGVERDDLLVEPHKAPLPLTHDLRLKAPIAVARSFDLNRPVLGVQRLRGPTVARVPTPARRGMVRLIAQVLGQLGIHRPLNKPARQIGQQAARSDDLLLAASTREQLIDQLVAEPLPDLLRQITHPERSTRLAPAGILLRSPSGLPPQNTGGTLLLRLNLRCYGHETPFRSCLHRRSDSLYGARPLRRVIQKQLTDRLALALLDGEFRAGDTVRVDAADGALVFAAAAHTSSA